MIAFTIPGKPATAGSKRGIPYAKREGGLGVRMIHDCQRFESWRLDMQVIASRAYGGPLIDRPVILAVTHYRQRPKAHYRVGKNAHLLRADAPSYPVTKPDLLKVVRALEDSLTGVIWRDDAQVIEHRAQKMWGDAESIEVTITCPGLA